MTSRAVVKVAKGMNVRDPLAHIIYLPLMQEYLQYLTGF
jgi:hypothetical protein